MGGIEECPSDNEMVNAYGVYRLLLEFCGAARGNNLFHGWIKEKRSVYSITS